jgi:peptide/nickel transport system substrate-binding protein
MHENSKVRAMDNSIDHAITRRKMLAWAGSTALSTVSVTGCGFFSTNPEGTGSGDEAPADTGAKESPMLQTKVAAGELPPLEQRIPSEPLVVEVPQPGGYGGTWTSVFLGPGDEGSLDRIVSYQPLLRKDVMCTETVPSLCTAVEIGGDGTEFTLRLRKGTRWSDGEPFTADDIVFAMEDVWGNTDLNPVPPSWLSQDDKLAAVEKVDDTTVKIIFPSPNGTFEASVDLSMDLVQYPKHYASKFLPKYNDKVEKDAKEADFETWVDYFSAKTNRWENVEVPVLTAWQLTKALGEGTNVTLSRNPYFWKTDPDGRQLPYIDELSFAVVQDPQVQVLKGTSGDVDMINRLVNTAANKPVFAASREQGDYRLLDTVPSRMNTMCIGLNMTNKKKGNRELYRKKDFRIGLSHAINREELITAVWQRQGEPWQAAPAKGSIYYDEEFAKQYTEYDVDAANKHLDKAGITERDNDGFRTLPGGEPLTVTLDMTSSVSEEWAAAGDMLEKMWGEVGVRLKLNNIDRTLFTTRRTADVNEHDAGVWLGDCGLRDETSDPYWYLPYSDGSMWGTTWAQWFNTRGKSGSEPIAPAKRQVELFRQFQQTPERTEREDVFRQILQIAKEEFWVIGVSTLPETYMVVSNRLQNVLGDIPDSWVFRTPAHANPEMWYLDQKA